MEILSAAERRNPHRLREIAWQMITCRRGSLWRVEEQLWIDLFSNYRSDRAWHPGLCLAVNKHPGEGLPSAIMTLGTSGSGGPLVVKGVSQRKGKNYSTSFGALLSPVAGIEFIERPDSDEEAKLAAKYFQRARISVNWDKRLLDQNELRQLDQIFPEWLWV